MKKSISYFLFSFLLISNVSFAQKNTSKPKLVVGIVIDQMRYDYLIRYAERYGEGGFKRILKDGFSLQNAEFNYIPTYTAVGHTSIYTGTTPSYHGIISNNWYDKFLKKTIYCVDDNNYKTVGNNGNAGRKSPKRMYTTTVSDELHLAQNMRGKVIGISLKDRAAILPVGHTANAAYWYDGGNNNQWITSSYYMKKLPNWVKKFNKNNKTDAYLNSSWNTLYDIKTYTHSIADDNEFEKTLVGQEKPTFPKNLKKLRAKNGNFDLIKAIPFGNSITEDFAEAAIRGEHLGKSDSVDFLSISFSSTDYVGHRYGLAAVETEDTYLRLDKDLADFFSFLDKKVGKGNYTLFLTEDHGAVNVPAYLQA
ncbi:MAG: alkaline phosphatase family protein, partial [Polaribacter sp.]